MKVEAQIDRLKLLANILRYKHQVVPVHPNYFYVRNQRAHLDHFLRNPLVDGHICSPIILHKLTIVFQIYEVVHFRLDQAFVVNQKILYFLKSNENREAFFLPQHFTSLLFFFFGKFVFCRKNTDPIEVECSLSTQMIKCAVEKSWIMVALHSNELVRFS